MTLVVPDRAAAAPFLAELDVHGERLAVVTADETFTYAELDARVDAVAEQLGPNRRLVLIEASNAVEPLVGYLAALRAGHPVLLVAGDRNEAARDLVAVYEPDVVIAAESGWGIDERRRESAHDLHPDLALLLSTSGSTGSSKLVRLSHGNLRSNADAIATYLELTDDDRAVTTLPMHYCYGLSVINSHLHRGAGLVMTTRSVVDRCFWDLVRAAGATSFAGVPHTFDLLERVGFDSMSLPTLRYLSQAGGRLPPDTVRRYAELGERDGWQLFVMYGQTEATARMAYLPPRLARLHPDAIGIPIPGGSFTIDGPDNDGVGELIYQGPNVMLGYAEHPADLALGATVDALHTGDLGRVTHDGLYEVVGRRNRFIKPYGLRVDLDHLERVLGDHGVASMCTGDDDMIVVAHESRTSRTSVEDVVGDHLGLPRTRVCIVGVDALPRLPNGKPDYAAVQRLAVDAADRHVRELRRVRGPDIVDHRRALGAAFAEILGTDPADDDSFIDCGGDSLSYVEMSIRLEAILGSLPSDWQTLPVGQLTPTTRPRRGFRQMETTVVLRALAIMLIVGTHTKLWHLPGGAHALLAIAGYNFARFQLHATNTIPSILRIAVPSVCWIAIVAATTDDFAWAHAALVNGVAGSPDARWAYWYVEAIVQILIPLALLLAIPAVRRLERRMPFFVAMAVFAAALAVRFDLVALPSTSHRLARPHEIFWLFALGWAAARATNPSRRLLVSALGVAAVAGFFGEGSRDVIVTIAVLLMIWVATVPLPRHATRLIGTIAGASLYIYLSHWQVYPPLLRAHGRVVAGLGSLLVGVAVWRGVRAITRVTARAIARRRRSSVPLPLPDHPSYASITSSRRLP